MRENERYTEEPAIGNRYRVRQREQFGRLIEERRNAAATRRDAYFQPDTSSVEAYELDCVSYRRQLQEMLGWPNRDEVPAVAGLAELADSPRLPGQEAGLPVRAIDASVEFVAEETLGTIHRLEVEAGYGLTTYGLLFLPPEGPHPLVLSQHGGWGTPELCSGIYGPSNYNDMTRRIWSRGVAVFAPQLLLWDDKHYGPVTNRHEFDRQLKQLGSSIAAVEIFKLRRCLDYFVARPDWVDGDRIGMVGLSYGGFYTLFTAALDRRIKAAYSSCFVNDRLAMDWSDFTWFNSAPTFLDAEVCALVAPRYLHVEAGEQDEVFLCEGARSEMDRAAKWYSRLGLGHRFNGITFDGSHEFNPGDEGLAQFFRYLLD